MNKDEKPTIIPEPVIIPTEEPEERTEDLTPNVNK